VSDERNEDAAPDPIRPASDPVAALRLRPARPRVTRLSRKVLTGGAAIALVAVSGAVFWALQSNRHRNTAPEELYSTDHRTTADGLAGLPRDYAGIPRQAPPARPAAARRPRAAHAQRRRRVEHGYSGWTCGRSGGATSCAGNRGGMVEPAVRIDQCPGVALGCADTRVGE